ncbi:hypothetical protein PMAYCL1PPCAC_14838, partial [Pristionchus mayeri]
RGSGQRRAGKSTNGHVVLNRSIEVHVLSDIGDVVEGVLYSIREHLSSDYDLSSCDAGDAAVLRLIERLVYAATNGRGIGGEVDQGRNASDPRVGTRARNRTETRLAV